MASEPYNPTSDYQPESTVPLPALYRWPPEPLAALRYLVLGMLFPWGYIYIALAFVSWYYLTPALETMASFAPGWIAMIWLRNALLLTLIAGGLHWWLYMRRDQNEDYKYHRRWLDTDNDKFLWRNQVRDNMFWSLVSGVTIWSAYEAISFWIYANGYLTIPSIGAYMGHTTSVICRSSGLGAAHGSPVFQNCWGEKRDVNAPSY